MTPTSPPKPLVPTAVVGVLAVLGGLVMGFFFVVVSMFLGVMLEIVPFLWPGEKTYPFAELWTTGCLLGGVVVAFLPVRALVLGRAR